MPVVGVPITPSSPVSDLVSKTAKPATLFGEEIITRRPGVNLAAGTTNNISVALIDEDGNHIIGSDTFSYKCRFAEAVHRTALISEVDGNVEDVDYTIVGFSVPPEVSTIPGVYIASIGIFVSNVLRDTYDIWIYNEPSLWGAATDAALPPIAEVRALIRDSSIVENELLNERQFGIEEIAQAAVETVYKWNNTPPFLGELDTRNFCSRTIYLAGIKCYLFSMLVEWYRKNRLPYSAGGVSVDDMGRLQEYMIAVQKEEQELTVMIQRTKAALNLASAFGKIG